MGPLPQASSVSDFEGSFFFLTTQTKRIYESDNAYEVFLKFLIFETCKSLTDKD